MLKADTSNNPSRIALVYFIIAATFLVIGGISGPLYLASALGFIAVGFSARRSKQDVVTGAVLLVLVLLTFGYGIGKDLAHRDSARPASESSTGA